MLRKLIADHRPHIAASFDLAGPTFRDALVSTQGQSHADAGRSRRADHLGAMPVVRWAFRLSTPKVRSGRRDWDAGDKGGEAGFDVAIVTGDKDFFQLVGGPIRVFNPRDEGAWFDADGVLQKFGVRPNQVVDVLALMGDSIDNIKGVPGIGEKGARDLIAAHASLDALLERRPTSRRSATVKRFRPTPTRRVKAASCCASERRSHFV